MNLADVSALDVARLAAAAAFGWGLVSAFWNAVGGAFAASLTVYLRRHVPVVRLTTQDKDDAGPTPSA